MRKCKSLMHITKNSASRNLARLQGRKRRKDLQTLQLSPKGEGFINNLFCCEYSVLKLPILYPGS